MSKVVVDRGLQAQLNGLAAGTEFCDENGRRLGYFIPDDEFARLAIGWFNGQISDEELGRLRRQSGGRPLKEIWRDLGRP